MIEKKKISEIKKLVKTLKTLTESKVFLKEGRNLSNTTLIKEYVEELLRKANVKEKVLVKATPVFVVVLNKNPEYTFDNFKPVINYLIKKKKFVRQRNKLINRKSFLVLKDLETNLSILFQNPKKD